MITGLTIMWLIATTAYCAIGFIAMERHRKMVRMFEDEMHWERKYHELQNRLKDCSMADMTEEEEAEQKIADALDEWEAAAKAAELSFPLAGQKETEEERRERRIQEAFDEIHQTLSKISRNTPPVEMGREIEFINRFIQKMNEMSQLRDEITKDKEELERTVTDIDTPAAFQALREKQHQINLEKTLAFKPGDEAVIKNHHSLSGMLAEVTEVLNVSDAPGYHQYRVKGLYDGKEVVGVVYQNHLTNPDDLPEEMRRVGRRDKNGRPLLFKKGEQALVLQRAGNVIVTVENLEYRNNPEAGTTVYYCKALWDGKPYTAFVHHKDMKAVEDATPEELSKDNCFNPEMLCESVEDYMTGSEIVIGPNSLPKLKPNKVGPPSKLKPWEEPKLPSEKIEERKENARAIERLEKDSGFVAKADQGVDKYLLGDLAVVVDKDSPYYKLVGRVVGEHSSYPGMKRVTLEFPPNDTPVEFKYSQTRLDPHYCKMVGIHVIETPAKRVPNLLIRGARLLYEGSLPIQCLVGLGKAMWAITLQMRADIRWRR